MKVGSQFLVAARLLSATPGLAAQWNLYTQSRQVSLYCNGPSVLLMEGGVQFPPEAVSLLSQARSEQEKFAAIRQILQEASTKDALLSAARQFMTAFFSEPLVKCELKARQYPEGLAIFTVFGVLHDFAGPMMRGASFDDLVPNRQATFLLAPGALQRSTQLKVSAKDGYLLSRLESPQSISEIVSVVPGEDEEQIKRRLLTLWASGLLYSPALEQKVPRIQPLAPPKSDPAAAPEPQAATSVPTAESNATSAQDIEYVNQTYLNLAKKDFYSMLGVSSRVELPEIKAAYYKLARRFHPDRFYGIDDPVLKEKVDIIFSTINVAYETLKSTKARTAYDNAPVEEKKIASTTLVGYGTQPEVKREDAMVKVAEDYYKRSQAAFDTGNYYQAVQFLRSATQIDPQAAKYWRQLGISLSKNPQWKKEAEDSFNKALELEPKNPDNHLYLGFLYKNMGLKLRAKKHFATCLELDPGNELAAREIGLIDSEESPQAKKGMLGGLFKKK
jgi:curved DNA-binding protein CbpA